MKRLIAFTDFPLRDGRTLGLYAWDNYPKENISILSTYDLLDQVKPPLSIERMVANAVASFIIGLPAHKGGPKNCVSFYNEDCEIEYIAGPLKVCPKCRRQLTKDRAKLAVVEKLLKAYP